MINLKKKANFKFSFNFDEINNLKMPKVYAHVINLSRPKKINMQIYSNLDSCVKNVAEYEVEFNNVNYTLILDFNTDSNDIITTIVTDFDAYQYSEERYLYGNNNNNQNTCDNNGNDLIICVEYEILQKKKICLKLIKMLKKDHIQMLFIFLIKIFF